MPVILVLLKIIMFPCVIQAIFGAFLFWILRYLHEVLYASRLLQTALARNRRLIVAEDD